jgi:hypothetical protein
MKSYASTWSALITFLLLFVAFMASAIAFSSTGRAQQPVVSLVDEYAAKLLPLARTVYDTFPLETVLQQLQTPPPSNVADFLDNLMGPTVQKTLELWEAEVREPNSEFSTLLQAFMGNATELEPDSLDKVYIRERIEEPLVELYTPFYKGVCGILHGIIGNTTYDDLFYQVKAYL